MRTRGAIKNLKEASEDAAEKSDWINKFKSEASKVKTRLENEWYKVKDKWHQVISNENEDHDDDDDDYDAYDDDDDGDDKRHSKSKRGRWSKKNRTSGVKDDTNWVMKRGEEREKLRRG